MPGAVDGMGYLVARGRCKVGVVVMGNALLQIHMTNRHRGYTSQ